MFCCNPRSLLLSLSKLTPDYDNKQLYHDNIPNLLKQQTQNHLLPKYSYLEIDQKGTCQFKTAQHNSQSKFAFHLCDSTHEIIITETMTSKQSAQLWRVLTDKQSHSLQAGDKIKIGLSQFEIYSKMTAPLSTPSNNDVTTKQHCRYCFANTQNQLDPLISLCKCSGSVRFLHLSCLRSWLNSKVEKELRQNVSFYIYHNLDCQLCKSAWPLHFTHQGRPYDLLAFDDPEDSFQEQETEQKHLILLTDSLDEEELQIKIFAKLDVSSRFSIGDEYENADLSLDTFGVSPIHCSFYFENDDIYVIDCGSTTGTLVSMHQEESFSTKHGIIMQLNQTIIQLKAEEKLFECLYPETVYKIHLKSRSVSYRH